MNRLRVKDFKLPEELGGLDIIDSEESVFTRKQKNTTRSGGMESNGGNRTERVEVLQSRYSLGLSTLSMNVLRTWMNSGVRDSVSESSESLRHVNKIVLYSEFVPSEPLQSVDHFSMELLMNIFVV
jgi:hypothetical protein